MYFYNFLLMQIFWNMFQGRGRRPCNVSVSCTIRDIMQYYNSVIKPLKSHVQCENKGNDMHVTFVGFFCIK
jgi:hypothetical protein